MPGTAERIRNYPATANVRLDCIHGDMNQRDRDRVFADLRSGTCSFSFANGCRRPRDRCLNGLAHYLPLIFRLIVCRLRAPRGPHRRMGRDGIAFTFVTADEGGPTTTIESK